MNGPLFNASYEPTLGDDRVKLEVIGFIRGTHTNSNHLMAIVRDGKRLYEIKADIISFDSWTK